MRADAMHTAVSKTPAIFGRLTRTVVALGLLAAATGCTTAQKQGDASSYLTVLSLVAAPGAEPETSSTVLASDVRTFGTAYSDPMVVTMRLGMKDPTLGPSPTNFVTVQKYHVKYTRSDGGAVPDPFDAAATFTVTTSDASSGPITLVRAQAKMASPLNQLVGKSQTVPVIAEITFDGVDQAGKSTSVTGFISINFADWADPGGDPTTPQASFTISPAAGLRAGQMAQFDGSASTVPSGRTVTSYTWDFGDGQTASSMSPTVQHVYNNGGAVTIRLTVTDSAGQTYISERTITVIP
jgi:hypothetical protein